MKDNAFINKAFSPEKLLLYAVTDRSETEKMCAAVESALVGGATMIQLREKNIDDVDYIKKAVLIKEICKKYAVPLIVNDNFEVALKSGADGVHVGAEDMRADEIRKKAPCGFIVGVTAKTVEQALAAQKLGADYLGVGAVFPSPTKPDAIGITREKLQEICAGVKIPCVAIGGISLENADLLRGSGISGIAVVSALFSAGNVTQTARMLRKKAEEITLHK